MEKNYLGFHVFASARVCGGKGASAAQSPCSPGEVFRNGLRGVPFDLNTEFFLDITRVITLDIPNQERWNHRLSSAVLDLLPGGSGDFGDTFLRTEFRLCSHIDRMKVKVILTTSGHRS